MTKAYWLGALAALLATSSVSFAADKIHVATPSRVIFAIPFWVAEHKGYFKDENIEATLEVVGSGKEITARLMSGASQFSIVGPDASIIDAMKGGPQDRRGHRAQAAVLFLISQAPDAIMAQDGQERRGVPADMRTSALSRLPQGAHAASC